MNKFPGYRTDPKVQRTINKCRTLGHNASTLRSESGRWYNISTLRGSRCTESYALRKGMHPEFPGVTVLYGKARDPGLSPDRDEQDNDSDAPDIDAYDDQDIDEREILDAQDTDGQDQSGGNTSILDDPELKYYLSLSSQDSYIPISLASRLVNNARTIAWYEVDGNIYVALGDIL
jgi:hypothetical protein